MQDEASPIDYSEWLHASFHKAYPAQMKRIVERNNRYFTITPDKLFDYLYEHGVLTSSHLASAEFYGTLYESANKKNGYAKMMGLLESMGCNMGGDKIPGFCPATAMLLIARNMTKQQYAMVERICLQPIRANDLVWMRKCENSIRDAFQALGASIEISIDIMKSRVQNSRN